MKYPLTQSLADFSESIKMLFMRHLPQGSCYAALLRLQR